ncbi:unnamed protein product [Oncorhynchus mykiss]|uniref:Tankyrase 1-binding protein C-terminal domain-containing protein n=1 Tax=Oncorhynchus mykiss TaxID=8022 RepID=A0A060W8F2_ONCMY|nr:unnamed protein product [Oncorhynchus mykiss]
MAARVDVASGEVGQAGDAGIKPELGPKPCLIPKPFSLQRNTTFRSILAPKTLTMTPQPSQTTPTTSSKPEPCQPIKSTTIPELTNALKVPSAITPQTESTHITEQNQTALSKSLTIPKSEPPASTTSDPTGTSEVNQVSLSELDEHGPSDTGHSATGTEPVPSVTSTPLQTQSENTVSEPTPAVVRRHAGKDQAAHLGGGRKRLSMELTSRFESAGLSLPSQPPANQEREQEEKVTDSPRSPSEPECRLKHSTPLKEERDGEGVKEEGEKKGNSIQRRISLLLDSSSRLEALTNREEVPRPMKQAVSSGGVKQRIKDWAADTPPVQASNQRYISTRRTEDQISPVITPDEPDSTSPLEETEDPLPFPDISAPLLDTSVLRARAELRKSRRTRPTRAFRQSSTTIMLEEDPDHDWRFYDSSDKLDSLIRGDCASGEEQPRGREVCSQPSQPQRIALFSGMDPSALKAQLKKRGGGDGGGVGGAGGGEGVDTDRQTDRLSPSPSQLSRSPRRSSFLPGMSRVLPPVGNKGAGGDKSPSWLRELKSKKRSSQYNSEA